MDRDVARTWLIAGKLGFAFLGFSALVTEVATLVERNAFEAGNFFSYFTVEANSMAVISLVLSALALATGTASGRLDLYRGAVTLYMTTTILVFIVLLSGYSSDELTAVPWDNTVLHYIMPMAIILDWLLATRVAPIPFRRSLIWLIVPAAYLVYSLVRGPIAHWYPYPFMDPKHRGYGGVAITSVVIAVILVGITWVIASAPRWTGAARPGGAGR